MKERELCIVSIPSGYYPYVLIGWAHRVEGLEWEIVGARVIRRFGRDVAITTLAHEGPQRGTELLPAADYDIATSAFWSF